MDFSLKSGHAIKGIISALILSIAPILGVILRGTNANGYLIGFVVAILNILLVIGIGLYLKEDFLPEENEEETETVADKKKSDKAGKTIQ